MKHFSLLIITLMISLFSMAAETDPVIELRADRTVIYPQRMNLTGEETLLDILLMFPDQMQSGFDKMIDAYNLRLDNFAFSGNTRLLCSQIKANTISKVQICDNTAIAKGTIGMGRVIDINLMPMEQGAHGFVSAQYGTDNMIVPSAQVMVGMKNTEIYANTSYTYQDKYDMKKNNQYLFFEMSSHLSKRDLLQAFFSQQYLDNVTYSPNKTQTSSQRYVGNIYYYHDFNDKGTNLLFAGRYIYSDVPTTTYYEKEAPEIKIGDNILVGLVELNTPIFTKDLNMMLGWEGDFDKNTFTRSLGAYNQLTGGYRKSLYPDVYYEHTCMSSNNDVYLQFDYNLNNKWRFTLGDRIQFFHYGSDARSWNDTRNNWHASVIFKPAKNHQIQAGYFRKFFNPSYDIYEVLTESQWMDMQGRLVACNIDEFKLAYTYSRQDLSVNFTTSYFKRETMNNDWITGSSTYYILSDMWKTSASVYYKKGILAVNAGVNYYYMKDEDNYAAFTLAPTLSLPHHWQISPKAIFFTKYVTSSTTMASLPYSDYSKTYASLQVNKQLGKHFDLMGQWHDIFSKRYSAALFGVQYRF